MQRRKTKEEFQKELKEIWGDEYTLDGDYNGADCTSYIKHSICGMSTPMLPRNAKKQRIPCKYCNPNSQKDNEVYMYQLEKKYPGEYTLLDEYKGANKEITLRHNICGEPHTYEKATNVLRGISHCPFCHPGSNQNIESFTRRVKELYGDEYTVVGKYINSRTKIKMKHNICSHKFKANPNEFLQGNEKCNVCTPNNKHTDTVAFIKKMKMRYGDKFTLLEAFRNVNEEHIFLCNNCSKDFPMEPSRIISNIAKCPYCDGGYYPEKYMKTILDEANIKYIFQYTRKNAKWCGNYRYDFYLEDFNWIIEVHGLQHYKDSWQTLEKTQINDAEKKKHALRNGITNYIVIDCRKSNYQYIKKHILETDLKDIIPVDIQWDKCDLIAKKSNYTRVIKAWNEGDSPKSIQEEYRIDKNMFYRIMAFGVENNLLKRDYKRFVEEQRRELTIKSNSKKVKCIETGKIFKSTIDAEKALYPNLKPRQNIACCARGKQNTAYGYHWKYI